MNNPDVTYFAETDARNKRVPFGIKNKDRAQHIYIIGKTGMGKSTTLENMAIQDINNGRGLAFLDPHGKTADLFLEYVPEHRLKDVIYFAPFDLEHPISFNVMEDVGPDKRHLVTSGLMSAFKKIWVDAWSARMEYILNNILLALLEYPDSTLIGVNRMLSDKDYRKKVVDNITDPAVKLFWTDEFAKYSENYMREAGAAIQNKVGQFVSNPLIRNIIGQPKSTFDIREIMDNNKILIINLSKGLMGEANANLLGSMIITKIYLAALSRADATEKQLAALPPFYLYVDEFQNFANESFAGILSEARKYKLCLTVAHQYIEQMSEEVRAAVFGNVGTMISFRVGAYDAEVLEKEFAPVFTAEDMVNLGKYQIYLKLMIDGVTSPPFSATTLNQWDRPIVSFRKEILEHSHKMYSNPRAVVEQGIKDWHMPMNVQNAQAAGRGGANGKSTGEKTSGGSAQAPAAKKLDAESSANLKILAKSVAIDSRQKTDTEAHSRRPSLDHNNHSHNSSAHKPGHSHNESTKKEKPLSLGELGKQTGKISNTQKEASTEHVQSLRDALKAYIRPDEKKTEKHAAHTSVTTDSNMPIADQKNETVKSVAEEAIEQKEHIKHVNEEIQNETTEPKKKSGRKPKEIEKDVLLKILKGEEGAAE